MIESIYQKILGKEFEKLGKNLQIGHKSFVVIGKGSIDVEWGKGWLIKMINQSNGLPPEGLNQPLELEVIRKKDHEVWKRKFMKDTFTTIQFERKGLLLEKDGPITLGFQLLVEGSSMIYKQKFMRFSGIPVPGFLSAKSRAIATEQDEGWKVEVEVKAPVIGRILIYRASIKLVNFAS